MTDYRLIYYNIMDTQINTPDVPPSTATPADRLRYLIKLTRHNQSTFCKQSGLDPGYLSRVLSGKLPLTEGFINRVVVNLGVSKAWLVDGEGLPFPRTTESRADTDEGAPVYDVVVNAGTAPLSRMFTEEHIIGRVKLPGINTRWPIVRVNGNSMTPRLLPGCYISIRPVPLDSTLVWGRIYVVVLPDFRLVKTVRRHDDPAKVILHSANPDYDDIEVLRSDIESLYLVENVINYDLLD